MKKILFILAVLMTVVSSASADDTTPNYLCFTAEEAGAEVDFTLDGKMTTLPTLQYSTDKVTWSDYTLGDKITLTIVGDKVYFKATNTNGTFTEGSNNSIKGEVKFHATKKVAASGNIMSLLDATCQQTTLPDHAFYALFEECSNLTTAPELPATTLNRSCYAGMFWKCTSLKKAPELPATTLAEQCYHGMFGYCTSLILPPDLPATTLVSSCYYRMFEGCTKLSYLKVGFSSWDNNATASYATEDWVKDITTVGKYICPSDLDLTPLKGHHFPSTWSANNINVTIDFGNDPVTIVKGRTKTNIPTVTDENGAEWSLPLTYSSSNPGIATVDASTGAITAVGVGSTIITASFAGDEVHSSASEIANITVIDIPDYLCFTAGENEAKVGFNTVGSVTTLPSLQYSTDKTTWADYTIGDKITLERTGDKVYFKATDTNSTFNTGSPNVIQHIQFESDKKVAASGNVMSLLDETCQQTTVPDYALSYLFYNCSNLTAAPSLPAVTVGYNSYTYMFGCCTGLTEAPALPATTLGQSCYLNMFYKCSNLVKAPALPAETLAKDCYYGMFNYCTSLMEAPKLPATTIGYFSYDYMFNGCTSLNSIAVSFTDWGTEDNHGTDCWVTDVASKGVFICPEDLEVKTGVNYIPEGWVVAHDKIDLKLTVDAIANQAVGKWVKTTVTQSTDYDGVTPSVPLTYTSSNTSVATVGDDGYIRTIGEGDATITVSFAGDDIYNAAEVTTSVHVIASGSCGDDMSIDWMYEDGVLTLTCNESSAEMPNYDNTESSPWNAYNNDVKKLYIDPKITTIGAYAFANLTRLTSVYIGDNIKKINDNAFVSCTNLDSVFCNHNNPEIGENSFPANAKFYVNNAGTNWEKYGNSVESYNFWTFRTEHYSLTLTDETASSCIGTAEMDSNHDITIGALSKYNVGSLNLTRPIFDDWGRECHLVALKDNAFKGTTVSKVYLPTTLKSLGKDAFTGCGCLNSVTFHSIPSFADTDLSTYGTTETKFNFILDDNSYVNASTSVTSVTSATYTRTMSNTWGTIVLPFDVKSDATTAYYKINGINNDVLTLSKYETLPAGTPALVKKLSGDGIAPSSTGTTVNTTINNITGNTAMTGSYTDNTKVEDANAYYIYNNKFYLNNQYFFVDAFRAYFTYTDSKAKPILLSISDNTVTAIDALTNDSSEVKIVAIYDASGAVRSELGNGLNIVRLSNGKTQKILVK